MKILYLYGQLKLNGPGYHRSREFTQLLSNMHDLQFYYAVLSNENYGGFKRDDLAFREFISEDTFLESEYDCVVVDGEIFIDKDFPRVPESTLRSFYNSGGITLFLYDEINPLLNGVYSVRAISEYLGACRHGHGGLFSSDPSCKVIMGVQRGDTHLEIEVNDKYLSMFSSSFQKGIYRGITKLVAEQALHLHMGDEWICIGDRSVEMVDDFDLSWDGPKPFIFGNISMGVGATCFLTGHLWNDYIVSKYPSDNLKFMANVIELLEKYQVEMGYHKSSSLQGSKPLKTSKAQLTDVTPILFLAADPSNVSRLRLGEESREIQEKLQLSRLREHFTLHQRMSVRPVDISQALLDLNPKIVHFSGHGTDQGALCVENHLGEIHPIQPDALAALFEQFASQVECVVLNACYAEIQARAIAQYIGYVIGMSQEISDEAAIAFAIGFYQALGGGRTIEEAYRLGCVHIALYNIPAHLKPVLIKKGQV